MQIISPPKVTHLFSFSVLSDNLGVLVLGARNPRSILCNNPAVYIPDKAGHSPHDSLLWSVT